MSFHISQLRNNRKRRTAVEGVCPSKKKKLSVAAENRRHFFDDLPFMIIVQTVSYLCHYDMKQFKSTCRRGKAAVDHFWTAQRSISTQWSSLVNLFPYLVAPEVSWMFNSILTIRTELLKIISTIPEHVQIRSLDLSGVRHLECDTLMELFTRMNDSESEDGICDLMVPCDFSYITTLSIKNCVVNRHDLHILAGCFRKVRHLELTEDLVQSGLPPHVESDSSKKSEIFSRLENYSNLKRTGRLPDTRVSLLYTMKVLFPHLLTLVVHRL